MRVRVRYGQRELKRISRTATLGGLFLSFLKIGLVGFGGGLAVIAQIRTLTVRKRHWLNEFEFAEGFALYSWRRFFADWFHHFWRRLCDDPID
jgi:chromate transporter